MGPRQYNYDLLRSYSYPWNNVKQISSGYNHSGALLTDGTAKVWGNNSGCQLGQSDIITSPSPKVITQNNNITHLVLGNNDSFVVLSDYSIRSFGLNTSGQLGIGHTTNSVVPKLVNNTQALTIPMKVETFDPVVTGQLVSGTNSGRWTAIVRRLELQRHDEEERRHKS
jgi:hypothetical protein